MNRTQRFLNSTAGQIVTFVLLFALLRALWMFAFYNGFNGSFEALCERVGVHASDCCIVNPFHSSCIFLVSYANPVFAVMVIVSLLPLVLRKKIARNSEITFARTERMFLFFLAFIISWELATYDYNYYLDNGFYFDRVLLIILPFVVYYIPATAIVYVAFALVYRAQFNYPVEGFPMFDKRLLFDLLMASVVFQYCRIFIRQFRVPFFYFAICIVASGYFVSGMKKIFISPHGYEWVLNNDPANLFVNVHLRGWLSCVSGSTYNSLQHFIGATGHFFEWIVLLTELSALFVLRNRKMAIAILGGAIVMHTGIFIFGSMLFWKWMLVDAVLILILWRKDSSAEIFGDKTLRWFSVVVIAFSFLWLQPSPIGWHDTAVNQFFTYEVVDSAGNAYAFDKNQMNPYHQWFQFDHFTFLMDEPVLPVSGFGYVNDYTLAKKLQDPDSLVIKQLTDIHAFDAKKKAGFDLFISTFFHNRNKRSNETLWLSGLAPPHHLYTQVCTNVYRNDFNVVRFRVIYNLSVTGPGGMRSIKQHCIDEIEIPQ